MFINIKPQDMGFTIKFKEAKQKNKLLSKNLVQMRRQVDKLIKVNEDRKKQAEEIKNLETDNINLEKEINNLQEKTNTLIKDLM